MYGRLSEGFWGVYEGVSGGVSEGCLRGVFRVSGGCLGGSWGFLEHVRGVSGGFLRDVWVLCGTFRYIKVLLSHLLSFVSLSKEKGKVHCQIIKD